MTRTEKALEARSKLALAEEIILLSNSLGFKCKSRNKLMKLRHDKMVKKVKVLQEKSNN